VTILSTSEVPIGIRGLAIFLIGIGGFYLTIFVSYMIATLGENAVNYGVTPSNLPNYLIMDVVNYLIPAVFALSASYALFSQKKFARILTILYGCTSLLAFQVIVSGHPFFLFGIIGAFTLYYMWQPHVREYFQQS